MMACRKAEDRTGIKAAAQIAADRDIGPEPQANRLFQRPAKLCRIVRVGALLLSIVLLRIIEIPIARHLDMPVSGDEIVPGRHLEHAVEQGAHLMAAKFDRMIEGLGVPSRRHAGGEQRLHFGGNVERVIVPGIEQRLDAETVAGGEEHAVALVVQHECEFAAQMVHALRPEILVEMKGDLAVRAGAEAVAGRRESALLRLVAIEFTVHDDVGSFVLAGDRLIARFRDR